MSNTSANRTFHDVLQFRLSRRSLVRGGLVAAGLGLLGAGTRLGGLRPAAAQSPLRRRLSDRPARLCRAGSLRMGRPDLGWARVQAGCE